MSDRVGVLRPALLAIAIAACTVAFRHWRADPQSTHRAHAATATARETPTPGSFASRKRIVDRVGLIPAERLAHNEDILQMIEDESGVDIRFLFVPSVPNGNLETFAVREMRTLATNSPLDRRRMLVVYSDMDARMRIEVGPELQGMLPDGFIGYMIREHAATYFVTHDTEAGLRTLVVLIARRIRDARLGEPYDDHVIAFVRDSVGLASGGGAAARVSSDNMSQAGFLTVSSSTAAERAHFAPTSTPSDAQALYLEWLSGSRLPIDVPLFTPATMDMQRRLPLTRAFANSILIGEYRQPFAITVRDDRAMLVYTRTPFVSPHFLTHTDAGWQMDLAADLRDSREFAGGRCTWTLQGNDDYMSAFRDRFASVHGCLRVADGDNRMLEPWKNR